MERERQRPVVAGWRVRLGQIGRTLGSRPSRGGCSWPTGHGWIAYPSTVTANKIESLEEGGGYMWCILDAGFPGFFLGGGLRSPWKGNGLVTDCISVVKKSEGNAPWRASVMIAYRVTVKEKGRHAELRGGGQHLQETPLADQRSSSSSSSTTTTTLPRAGNRVVCRREVT
ncbi:hypothetical protein LX36DRAFT_148320 [Colletotrichum falcatum]|nr:hypothetical protein LX36DRAFT_148320 [Colletotrichum falcatum]